VTSLKIEGRLKSAHYVAATTQTYRQAVDVAAAGQKQFHIQPQQRADLEQTSRAASATVFSPVSITRNSSSSVPKIARATHRHRRARNE